MAERSLILMAKIRLCQKLNEIKKNTGSMKDQPVMCASPGLASLNCDDVNCETAISI